MAANDCIDHFDPVRRKVKKEPLDSTEEEVCHFSYRIFLHSMC